VTGLPTPACAHTHTCIHTYIHAYTEAFSNLALTLGVCGEQAVLMMYKVFLRFPDALRPSFPRIKDKLSEEDPSTALARLPCFMHRQANGETARAH
jgi:hypothetical protein